jgi:ribonuclease HI
LAGDDPLQHPEKHRARPGVLTTNNGTIIYTDGACRGNPGPGGWAAVLLQDGKRNIISGNDRRTTNNRMELLAAIKGLEAAPRDQSVTIYTDSQYLVNTMTKGWQRNANLDLWELLDRQCQDRRVTWKWVRGHNGTPGNEIADRVASMEAGIFDTRQGPPKGRPARPPSSPARRPARPGQRSGPRPPSPRPKRRSP